MDNLIKQAEQLLERCETVTLASVNQEGFPRICVLSRGQHVGIGQIFVSTGTDSAKTRHFRSNSRASLCFTQGGDSVTLLGHVTVLEDAQTKQDHWENWFIDHFPGGPTDPGYCVLRFDAFEATIWIGGVFETVSL